MKGFNQWFDKVFSKTNVLVISIIIYLSPYVFSSALKISECNFGGCKGINGDLFSIFYPTVCVIGIFALLTYFLKREVFASWIRFALVWLAFAAVLIAQTPHDRGFALDLDQKPMMVVSLALIFGVLSIIFVLARIIQVYWLKKMNTESFSKNVRIQTTVGVLTTALISYFLLFGSGSESARTEFRNAIIPLALFSYFIYLLLSSVILAIIERFKLSTKYTYIGHVVAFIIGYSFLLWGILGIGIPTI